MHNLADSAESLASPHFSVKQRAITLAVVVGPFLALALGFWLERGRRLEPLATVLLVVMFVANMLGVEACFHRGFSHGAFRTAPVTRFFLGVLGSMAAQGPLFFWVASHRRHHLFGDRPGDPHSPYFSGHESTGGIRGLWHAHLGWLFAIEPVDWKRHVPDLLRDPIAFRVHKYYFYWVALGLFVPAMAGAVLDHSWRGFWIGLLWGGFIRIFFGHHATWSVNSVCHVFGARPHAIRDRSTNNFWLSLTSMGGAWHNNHHAFPRRAYVGMHWWQLDPSGWFIGALEKVGLAFDVYRGK